VIEHLGVGEIVYVFRGAAEVQELFKFSQTNCFKLFLQEIFDRLYIMSSRLLNLDDPLCVSHREFLKHQFKGVFLILNQGKLMSLGWDDFLIKKCLKPLKFHKNSVLHQSKVGKVWAQVVYLVGVPSIKWAECSEFSHRFQVLG